MGETISVGEAAARTRVKAPDTTAQTPAAHDRAKPRPEGGSPVGKPAEPGNAQGGTDTGSTGEAARDSARFTGDSAGRIEDSPAKETGRQPDADGSPAEDGSATRTAATEGSATDLPDMPEAEEGDDSIKEKGRASARELLTERTTELTYSLPENPSDADLALIYEGFYVNGFPLEEGESVDAMGDIQVERDDGEDGKKETFTVRIITAQTGEPGDMMYTCKVTEEGKTETTEMQIPGDILAEAHRITYSDEIAGKFEDPAQKELMGLYAKGDLDQVSEGLLVRVEESRKPFRELDERIKEDYIPHLKKLSDALGDVKEGSPGYEDKMYLDQLINQLNASLMMDGRLLAAHARDSALAGIQKAAAGPGGEWLRDPIQKDRAALHPQVEAEQKRLESFVEGSGLSRDRQQQILDQAKNPEQLAELLKNPDFIGISGIMEQAIGAHITSREAQAIASSFIDASSLTDEEKKGLRKVATTAGKGALWAIIIALTIGVGAAGVGMLESVNAATRAGQR